MLWIMNSDPKKTEYDRMFYAAEQAGLKLAIKGRIVTVLLVATVMAVSRGAARAPDFMLAAVVFVGFHFMWLATRDRDPVLLEALDLPRVVGHQGD